MPVKQPRTFPWTFSGSNLEPDSTLSSRDLYLPVKKPPPTSTFGLIFSVINLLLFNAILTGVEGVELDTELPQAREKFRFGLATFQTDTSESFCFPSKCYALPVNRIVDSLVDRRLDIPLGLADTNNLRDFPPIRIIPLEPSESTLQKRERIRTP